MGTNDNGSGNEIQKQLHKLKLAECIEDHAEFRSNIFYIRYADEIV